MTELVPGDTATVEIGPEVLHARGYGMPIAPETVCRSTVGRVGANTTGI